MSAMLGGAQPSAAQPSYVLPIRFHVVHVAGTPVAPPAFVADQLARANAIFAPYGVQFASAAATPLALPAVHAALETRADRDALAAHARPGAIDCFIVRSLRDVDEPPRMRRGVHWHARGAAPAHYVILSAIAGPDVLAHELGHYLGNPKHSDTPGNLMSYDRAEPALPFLDAGQLRRMRAAIRRYVKSGELRLERARSGDTQVTERGGT